MKTINFAIIGCGDVTEKKSGPAFQKLEGSHLAAVMRRDEEKLKDYARRHQVPKYTTDYLEILRDPSIDAVYIATPPQCHHFYTLEAAKYGKAVYVEKPMATTVEQCKEMVEACRKRQVPLFVAYYRRGQEKFRKVKELLESGAIGKVRSFSHLYVSPEPKLDPNRAWLLDKEVAGGGLLFDVGSHMIDILLFLFGEVDRAHGLSTNQGQVFEVNDVTSGMIRFRNGVQGTLQLSFNGGGHQDELRIVGSTGSLSLSILSNDPVRLEGEEGVREFAFDPLEHVQMPYIKRVVDTLRGLDDYDTSGAYGLKTQEILEAFEESSAVIYN
ncbi:Gfo/Idh/MocA family protein [Anaerotalea alkaliphila]|uniref:Gfo/Idh/MocA family oxidoreductase n=1 Tax=Anaerotalea alkaliphila TaxID=2662126 RepID=A0A7X5HWQ0_9FIRM|nr:Gfo/Idh/MocA family oxidoreductase [Anaerotalea alkaliphila]NDL67871.1 Gfo/Idh/MocA family oxidoreductase [Anaerotalea alkaliphila]